MRLLFISLEFSSATFSGNGVYAISQVAALAASGHDVLVVAGRPEGADDASGERGGGVSGGAGGGSSSRPYALLEVPLPSWGRLDRFCGWQVLADGAASPRIVAAAAAFGADAVLGVDWHSLPAYRALCVALADRGVAEPPPYVYNNYRVYLRTAEGDDAEFYASMEGAAVEAAVLVTCLSRSDAAVIAKRLRLPGRGRPDIEVLLPALRADMSHAPLPGDIAQEARGAAAALQDDLQESLDRAGALNSGAPLSREGGGSGDDKDSSCGSGSGHGNCADGGDSKSDGDDKGSGGASGGPCPSRKPALAPRSYLLCCVRLSPEKEPLRFVDLVAELQRRGALTRHGLVPFMVGASDSEYARRVKSELRAAAPHAVVEERFLGPGELVEQVYSRTRLNVHPCLYDAYGMTVVEAAAQGAPSLVNSGGHVGATDLLSGTAGECFEADLGAPPAAVADAVEAILSDPARLLAVSARAAARARAWDLPAYAGKLVSLVVRALHEPTRQLPLAATVLAER